MLQQYFCSFARRNNMSTLGFFAGLARRQQGQLQLRQFGTWKSVRDVARRTAGGPGTEDCRWGWLWRWAYAFIMLSLGAFEGGWGAEFSKMSASLVARLVTGQHGSLHEGSRSGGPCTASKKTRWPTMARVGWGPQRLPWLHGLRGSLPLSSPPYLWCDLLTNHLYPKP